MNGSTWTKEVILHGKIKLPQDNSNGHFSNAIGDSWLHRFYTWRNMVPR